MDKDFLKIHLNRLPWYHAAMAALVYLSTMAPSISHTDSGELAAVCETGGIAHPTGYPLFTLLGWLWTRIPLLKPALQLNLLCLLFVAGGVYFFSKSLQLFFQNWRTKIKGLEDDGKSRVALGHGLAQTVGVLLLAFSQTFWMQSTSLEVYSLHILLLCLNLFLLLKAWYAPVEEGKPWLLLAGALALGFANHLSIFTFLPAIAWLFFAKNKFSPQAFKRLALMLAVFFPLLALQYLYLPLRAGSLPHLNWGNPQSWEAFWHHVTGKQFQVWMFTGMDPFVEEFKEFAANFNAEFVYMGIIFLVLGLYYGLKMRRNIAFALLGIVLLNVIYACNYHIKDLEPYFLPTVLASAFFMAIGFRFLWIKVKMGDGLRKALPFAVGAMVLVMAVVNYGKVNQRGAWQYDDYARACLESLPENAVVISKNWDVFVSPAYYLQEVEGIRPDVKVVEYQMLHDRHWYPAHLRSNMPELAQRIGLPLAAWEQAVSDFDLRGKLDPALLSRTFMAVFYAIVEELEHRPVYLGPEMYPGTMMKDQMPMPDQLTLVPESYFLRLIPVLNVSDYYPLRGELIDLQLPVDSPEPEPEVELLRNSLADVWMQRAVYELVFERKAAARDMVQRVRNIAPERALPATLNGL